MQEGSIQCDVSGKKFGGSWTFTPPLSTTSVIWAFLLSMDVLEEQMRGKKRTQVMAVEFSTSIHENVLRFMLFFFGLFARFRPFHQDTTPQPMNGEF